jgi:DNA replication protein DnaC
MKAAGMQMCRDMAAGVEPYSLALLGPSGAGKTYLAKLISGFFQAKLCDRAFDPYLSGPGEFWRCKGGMVDWGRAMKTMLDSGDYARVASYRNDFFLGLDDIAAEHNKLREFSASQLFDILNSRLAKRWTVITANCDLDGVGKLLDPRIASRLIRDGNVCIALPATTTDFALR